jgi:hypothetical protein
VLEECRWLRRDHKLSLRSAAAELRIAHLLLIKWSAKVPTLVAAQKKIRKSIFDSPPSQLEPIKEDLLMWIFVRCEQGLAVTMQHVILKACSLLKDCFAGKLLEARYKATFHFLKHHLFMYCLKINETTRPPKVTRQETINFMAANCPLLSGPHHNKRYILNMDQTPLWFSSHRMKTLAKKDQKTIHIQKFSSDTKRAICALLTITAASKDWLPPLIIF